jgi:CBS domain-containing protein
LQEILFRVGFLLAAALLLWPKNMLIDPLPLVIALGFASITAIIASVLLNPMIQVLTWLEEAQSQTTTEAASPSSKVKDFMRKDFPSLPLDTPVEQIPAILSKEGTGGVLIMDPSGKLTGIVTEADLFVKREKLPRTDLTYLALFQNPVQPEYISQSYSSIRGRYRASDIMSQPVVTISSDQPIGKAIHLMLNHGYKIIPVVEKTGGNEEQVIGVLTRTDLIQQLLAPPEFADDKLPTQSVEG